MGTGTLCNFETMPTAMLITYHTHRQQSLSSPDVHHTMAFIGQNALRAFYLPTQSEPVNNGLFQHLQNQHILKEWEREGVKGDTSTDALRVMSFGIHAEGGQWHTARALTLETLVKHDGA